MYSYYDKTLQLGWNFEPVATATEALRICMWGTQVLMHVEEGFQEVHFSWEWHQNDDKTSIATSSLVILFILLIDGNFIVIVIIIMGIGDVCYWVPYPSD